MQIRAKLLSSFTDGGFVRLHDILGALAVAPERVVAHLPHREVVKFLQLDERVAHRRIDEMRPHVLRGEAPRVEPADEHDDDFHDDLRYASGRGAATLLSAVVRGGAVKAGAKRRHIG